MRDWGKSRICTGHRARVCVKLGQKKRFYLSAFDCYLGDDLAVLSMDLSDAAPLCQEGEDLVELQEEDSKTVKTTLVPISCTSHEAERPLWNDGVTLKATALVGGRNLRNVQHGELWLLCVWSPEMAKLMWDELQLLFWLLCHGSIVSCMRSVLQAGCLQLPHASQWMSKLAMAAWETPRVQTHTLWTRVDILNTFYIVWTGQATERKCKSWKVALFV